MNISMRLIQKRGWYHYVLNGKWKALRTKDLKEAESLFKEIEKEYLKGRLIQLDSRRMSLKELQSDYEEHRPGVSKWTLKKDMLSLKLLREAVGDIQVRALTPAKIDDFKRICLSRGAKPQSVNGYLRHIKSALTYALDNSIIDKKPKIKMVPVDKGMLGERILPPKTLEMIFSGASPDFGRYLTVLFWTGARRREALDLCWQDVDLDRGSVLFRQTKGRQARRVPLLPEAIMALEPVKKDIGPVFPDWHPDTVSKWFHALALSCGVKARLHDLRHSAATYMLKSGIPIQIVKEILGHAQISTTLAYSHILDDVISAQMSKMKVE